MSMFENATMSPPLREALNVVIAAKDFGSTGSTHKDFGPRRDFGLAPLTLPQWLGASVAGD